MQTILIILLIFYAIMLLTRYTGPLLLRYFLKKVSDKMGHNFNGYSSQKETSNSTPKNIFQKRKDPEGEYIDFEEID